jgi:molybdenum cofactor guanylyltransferase
LPRSALPSLQAYLDSGERKVMRWLETLAPVRVPFDDCADAFRDADTPEELAGLQPSA